MRAPRDRGPLLDVISGIDERLEDGSEILVELR
jgi:hypothetical protein